MIEERGDDPPGLAVPGVHDARGVATRQVSAIQNRPDAGAQAIRLDLLQWQLSRTAVECSPFN